MSKSDQQATLTVVAKINNTEIVIVENGDQMVPVKPICDALGIASNVQIEKIKSHEILGSTHMLCISVGADGKNREMFSIPLKFIFGWLFTIDPGKVKPQAKEAVIGYQLQCYNVLYDHFSGAKELVEYREKMLSQIDDEFEKNNAIIEKMKLANKKLLGKREEVKSLTLKQFRDGSYQTTLSIWDGIEFEAKEEGGQL
jgi:hypothetical protein